MGDKFKNWLLKKIMDKTHLTALTIYVMLHEIHMQRGIDSFNTFVKEYLANGKDWK